MIRIPIGLVSIFFLSVAGAANIGENFVYDPNPNALPATNYGGEPTSIDLTTMIDLYENKGYEIVGSYTARVWGPGHVNESKTMKVAKKQGAEFVLFDGSESKHFSLFLSRSMTPDNTSFHVASREAAAKALPPGNDRKWGIELKPARHGVQIVGIQEGGPAHAAGLRYLDEIISFENQKIDNNTPALLSKIAKIDYPVDVWVTRLYAGVFFYVPARVEPVIASGAPATNPFSKSSQPVTNPFVSNNNSSASDARQGNQYVSVTDELEKLFELKEKGIITEEEFAAQKAKLLQ